MNQSYFSRFWYLSIPLLVGAVIAITWVNYRFGEQYPGGIDFLRYWIGTRALLVEGESPYGEDVALQLQSLAYGRPSRPGEDELRIISPLYFVAVFLPYALVSDFTLARAMWMTTLEIALIGLALISLRLTRWKLDAWTLLVFLLFAIFWYHSLRPLIAGDVVILIALWTYLAFLLFRSGRDELAGILLAFTTIELNVVLLVLVWVMIWTLSNRRWAALFWMVAAVAILSFIFGFFIPDWPLQNLREVMQFADYQPMGTPAAVFTGWAPAAGRWIGLALSGLALVILLVEWVLARRKDFRWFLWTASLTLVVSQWSGIWTEADNFIVLLLPLVLVFAALEERWGTAGRLMNWVWMLALFIVPWYFFWNTVLQSDLPGLAQFLLFPLPVFLLVTLYWVRWWAIRPRGFLIDALKESEALE